MQGRTLPSRLLGPWSKDAAAKIVVAVVRRPFGSTACVTTILLGSTAKTFETLAAGQSKDLRITGFCLEVAMCD